ncbi:cytochrome P450 3A29-like [Hemitrygon akajei]|uniref:cytochrome P450 3A29-like n=1 Tax=Hemitrygon akajei TaxID=2704970 RepID=UPI003BF9F303
MDIIQEFLIPQWVVPLVNSWSWLNLCDITSSPWLWRGFMLLILGLYATWPYSTFKELCIPGPSPTLFLGSIPYIYRKDIHVVDLECYNTYGNIWGLFLGREAFLMITDTEIIHRVFIEEKCKIFTNIRGHRSQYPFCESFFQADENEQQRLHQVLSPAFGAVQLKQMFPIVVSSANDLVAEFGKFHQEGKDVVVRELFAQYTRNALMMSVFNQDITKKDLRNDIFINHWNLLLQAYSRYSIISTTLVFPVLKPLFRKLKFYFYWKEVVSYFTKLVHQAQMKWEQSTESKEEISILHYLLEHAEAKTDTRRKQPPGYTKLSESEVVAQILKFLISAYKTTTFTLEFAVFLLARYPGVQCRLHQEILTTGRQKGFTYESIAVMEFLDMVVKETLRLFPPVVWVQAACTKSTEVCQLKIPKGIRVVVPVWVMHHSWEFWDNPCKFNPLRFTREEEDTRNPHCYLPFGLGHLGFVGSEFCIMMMKVAMVTVLGSYRFSCCSETPMHLEIETLGTTRSKEPITLQINLP